MGYPAIEALAFAVIELRQTVAAKERTAHIPEGNVWPTNNPVECGPMQDEFRAISVTKANKT